MIQIIISTTALFLVITAYFITLKQWINACKGRRHPSEIKHGERFRYYQNGKIKESICARNYSDIEVIYTGRNRVEYNQISKI